LNNHLHLTEYHPVKQNGAWIFPLNVIGSAESNLFCDAIFSFVIKKEGNSDSRGHGYGIIIGNTECATLGHGINEDVIAHQFFGTERVIDALKRSNDYFTGLVTLGQNSMVRDLNTNLICDIVI
jgi:hypothetical protein